MGQGKWHSNRLPENKHSGPGISSKASPEGVFLVNPSGKNGLALPVLNGILVPWRE
jgi:hypothetical protein